MLPRFPILLASSPAMQAMAVRVTLALVLPLTLFIIFMLRRLGYPMSWVVLPLALDCQARPST